MNRFSQRFGLLAQVKRLADNLHHLPLRDRELARNLVAEEIEGGLTERQLLQVARLNDRIKRERRGFGT
jgi:hypothetical protein